MSEAIAPLSAAEVEEIRERAAQDQGLWHETQTVDWRDVVRLLATIDWLWDALEALCPREEEAGGDE